MKRRITNKRKIKAAKIAVAILLMIALLALLLHTICISIIQNNCNNATYKNVIELTCQIVVSVVCCVVSILGIVISLQNENIYGIPRRNFDKLREGLHFSILKIVTITLALSVASIVSYCFSLYVTCIYCLVLLVAFCILACLSEIPVMCHHERSIFRIVKQKLKFEIQSESELPSDLKLVVKNIMTEDLTLQEMYQLCKKKHDIKYNKLLFIKLLELQSDYAFELSKLDENTRNEKAERLVNNVRDLLNFKKEYDAIKITDGEIWNYQHLITRVLFRTYEIQSSERKTVSLLLDSLPVIDHFSNAEHRRFILAIVIKMISCSLSDFDLRLANELKRVCSSWHYALAKGGALTTIFALTSVHLCYLFTSARNVTPDYKEKIHEFIVSEPVVNHFQTESWGVLYSKFHSEFSLNFREFFDCFLLNEHNWDMKILDPYAHFVVMDGRYAIEWFLANLFSSFAVISYDYNNLLSIDKIYHGILRSVGDEILRTDFDKDRMTSFVKFFIHDADISFFERDEMRNERFATFISDLHKKELDELIMKSELVDKNQLAVQYKEAIDESIKGEWGYSCNLGLEDVSAKFLKVIIELKSIAINYEEVMRDFLIRQINAEIERQLHKQKISRKDLSNIIQSANSGQNIYTTEYVKYVINQTIESEDLQSECKIIPVKSSILSGHSIVIDNAFMFNYEIKVGIENLSNKQLAEKAEEYKTQDGRYIYEGAILSREELEKFINQQYAILELQLKCKTNSDNILVYDVDLKY